MRTSIGILAVVVALVTAGAAGCASPEAGSYDLTIAGEQLVVELADDPESRARGLMHRESMPERHGMLFVFESSEMRSFWMKDTLIPLSIAYIDERLVIREIHDMEPLSLEPVPSRLPARYALEVNQGAFERLGIGVGDRLVPSAELAQRIGQ